MRKERRALHGALFYVLRYCARRPRTRLFPASASTGDSVGVCMTPNTRTRTGTASAEALTEATGLRCPS